MVFFSILYNPDDNAIKNIRIASKFGFKPVVYLNQVDSYFLNKITGLDCVVLGNNSNVGLGLAFYELEVYLSDAGEEYYIYFDQDTVTTEDTWALILKTYLDIFSISNTGMIFYGHNNVETSDLVVSSGCLFSMAIIRKIGNHNRTFFVEGVDYEFCLRLKLNHFVIRNIFTKSIDHYSLQDAYYFRIFGLNFPIRVYGLSRTRDFNFSHRKLIRMALRESDYWMFFKFIKSALLFNFREYFSRLVSRFF